MRILLLSPASSIHTIKWATAFLQRGHTVNLVSLPDHPAGKESVPEGVTIKYLSVHGSKGYYLNAMELREYAKTIEADVINAHYASGYGTLARMAGIHPLVMNVWGSDIYEFPNQSRIKKSIIKKNIKNADAIASTSYCMADETRKVVGEPNLPITITPFGVDTDLFKPLQDIKCSKETFVFGTVKSLNRIYGIDTIIMAFKEFYDLLFNSNKVIEKTPKLLIFGEGDNKREYVELINRCNLNNNIEIKGYVPNSELPELINSFDVSCFASIRESFGVSVVESMSCGIPVVVSDAEGFLEVVEDGETGFIVPRNDPSAMAAKMLELYHNNDLRLKMGKNGRKRVLDLYKWNNNVDILENLLVKSVQEGNLSK